MDVQPRALLNVLLTACLLLAPAAEARRAGGGKSVGMSRSNSSYQQPQYNTAPTQQPNYNTPTQQKSGSGMGGMLAAGVAGAAVGAVAANALANDREHPASQTQAQAQVEEKPAKGLPSWLWFVLIAGLAFFLFRKFGAKKKLAATNPYAPNYSGQNASNNTGATRAMPNPFPNATTRTGDNTNIFGQSVGGAVASGAIAGAFTQGGSQLPDGSEPAAFLRVARQRFNHIQAMNSASNIEEIRRYLTPELYIQMQQDIISNQDQDVAEFSNLNAMVTDSATENGQYVVSVRFTGTVSEDLNSPPQPFTEIWHFVKPVNSSQDWSVAGIQQV